MRFIYLVGFQLAPQSVALGARRGRGFLARLFKEKPAAKPIVEFTAEDRDALVDMFNAELGETLTAEDKAKNLKRAEQALRYMKEQYQGCPDKESTFNAQKLICDMDANGYNSKCRCADASKTLTAVKPCDVNHCGGAYSTDCLGVKDQKTAWINEFLSNAFMPVFNGCCDTHDEGYCVPGAEKLAVDREFYTCMANTCDSHHDHKVREECRERQVCRGLGRRRSCETKRDCRQVNKGKNKWCKLRAKIAFTAVERGGLKAFNAKMDHMMECQ